MPGRKRTPSAIRQGETVGDSNYSTVAHRRISPEPNFPTGIRCPTFLDKLAKREWRRIVTALSDLDLLRATDTAVLASYCAAYSRWEKAERELAAKGAVIEVDGSQGQKKFIKNPQLMVSEQSQKMMLRAGSLLGFTPADRSKVSAPPKQAENPFSKLDDDDDEE